MLGSVLTTAHLEAATTATRSNVFFMVSTGQLGTAVLGCFDSRVESGGARTIASPCKASAITMSFLRGAIDKPWGGRGKERGNLVKLVGYEKVDRIKSFTTEGFLSCNRSIPL